MSDTCSSSISGWISRLFWWIRPLHNSHLHNDKVRYVGDQIVM